MSRMFMLCLLSLTLRSLILAALVGTALIFTKKVQIRHAAWTVVLCFLFLMPIADALLPAALVPASVPEVVRPIQGFVLYAGIPSSQPVMDGKALPAAAPTDWWYIAATLMVSITAGFLVRLALVLREIVRLKRSSHAVPEAWTSPATNISVRESGLITIPLTIGVWKPVLMLPLVWRDWDEWKLCAVLTHERIHVERRDWMVAVIASVAKCLSWSNPLAWWLERKLSSLAEQASDEACVRACGDAPRYAETLLEFASAASRKDRLIGGVAMAQYRISQRIERVLALRRPGSGVLPQPSRNRKLRLSIAQSSGSSSSRCFLRLHSQPYLKRHLRLQRHKQLRPARRRRRKAPQLRPLRCKRCLRGRPSPTSSAKSN